METTTLCYLRQGSRWLLLYRNKKKEDPNAGYWIAPGGHVEEGESPLDCVRREFREETGLHLPRPTLRGLVSFIFNGQATELTFLYTADEAEGDLRPCEEGELAWVEAADIPALPLWEGDRIFLPRLLSEDGDFFALKLEYQGRTLTRAVWEADGKKDLPPFTAK